MKGRLPIVACVALALASLALGVLAVQVSRHPGETARHDAILLRNPPPERTWAERPGFAASLLGAQDDVTFRRAIALFLRGRPDDPGGNKTTDQIVSGIVGKIKELGLL